MVVLGYFGIIYFDFIEYVIVEDDYVGFEECFSEILLCLLKDVLFYVLFFFVLISVNYCLCENFEVVNIGIVLIIMKLNLYFLEVLKVICDCVKVKVYFYFVLG